MRFRKLLALLVLPLLLAWPMAQAAETRPLLVFAAASLTNVLDEIGASYSTQPVKFSYGASSTLARQIEAGANADIFFSADLEWMDYLQARKLIDVNTRASLLSNKLVLIAPIDSKIQLKIAPNFALAAALGKGRLATGDPDSVPVGKYARSALTSLGVWNDVVDKLVRGDSVRTALAFVDRGEASLGIVYATDAFIDKKVRIVDEFPPNTHPAIVYPIALTVNATRGAEAFVSYLRGPTGQAAFKKYGFIVLQ